MQVYEAYPAAISTVVGTLLRQAFLKGHEEVVRYICTHHPNVLSIPNTLNHVQLHNSMHKARMSIMQIIYEIFHQSISISDIHGQLPIHHLMFYYLNNENDLAANKLRFLLSKCPECVNVHGSPQDDFEVPQTTYDLSLSKPDFGQKIDQTWTVSDIMSLITMLEEWVYFSFCCRNRRWVAIFI
jgi:hypothetical protein